MNAAQIEELTYTVIETSEEDNLSLEDVVLFLQRLVRGEYGANYESMDITKFMEKFEVYREDRYQSIRNLRDEETASHRPDYSDTRLSEQRSQEENLKNIAALLEYSRLNPGNEQKGQK